jgi:hypothetical protein
MIPSDLIRRIMKKLIDADVLYEKVADLEAQALEQVNKYNPVDSRDEWRWWSAVLTERTAFKYDVADAPAFGGYRWISCNEKMPEEGVDVLLQFSSNMGVGFYEHGWAINTGDGIYSEVGEREEKPVAWMKLPEPWKGD